MYKIPKFVKIIHNGDNMHLQSPVNSVEVKITSEFVNELKNIQEHGCTEINSDLEKFLYENELLMNNEGINDTVNDILKASEQILNLVVLPTETCNFRCPYCYEVNNNIVLNDRKLEHLKQFVAKNIHAYKAINIAWFGGEPTLYPHIVCDLNSYVMHLNKNTELKFSSSITTNGYLLNKNMFLKFYENNIKSYQITIDGLEHDKTRYLANGNATLETILNNLKIIKTLPIEKYNFKIIIRNNILEDRDDTQWYDYFKKVFGDDARFLLFIKPVDNYGGERIINMTDRLSNNKRKLIEKHVSYVNRIGAKLDNSNNLNRNLVIGDMCYAALRNSYTIRPNGIITKCTLELDHPLNTVGYIDDEKGVIIDEEKNMLWCTPKLKKDCYDCEKVISCLGIACPKKLIIKNEDMHCNFLRNQ